MDFGLRGRTAIVCAASMGLGRSCATALGGEGVKLVVVARRREILERAAGEIRSATGTETVAVVADVMTKEGRDAILAACPNPDILINNAGGPPAGDFRNWDRSDWIKALDANMLARVEGDNADRVVELARHEISNYGFEICPLGFGFAVNAAQPAKEVNYDLDSLIRAVGTFLGVPPVLGIRNYTKRDCP